MQAFRKHTSFLYAVLVAFLMMTVSASYADSDRGRENNENKMPRSTLLNNVQVTGVLSDGGNFSGRLTITSLAMNEAGQLVASGFLKGKADGKDVNQSFANVVSKLSGSTTTASNSKSISDALLSFFVPPAQAATCNVLFLDLGPLALNLLGLTVDLSQITLDINAVTGAGNLVGNLLCAVVGLLDGVTLNAAVIGIINNILGVISSLL